MYFWTGARSVGAGMRKIALELPTPLRVLKSPFPNQPPPKTATVADASATDGGGGVGSGRSA